MRHSWKTTVSSLTLLALVAAIVPVAQAAGGAKLAGTLIQPDGRPAAGYHVHLIDSGGEAIAKSKTGERGSYSFKGLATDEYSLGIENPNGQMAPVMAAPLHLRSGDHADLNVKMLEGGPGAQGPSGNYALGIWWAGLSTPAKVWTIVGTLAVVGITASALDDEEDDGSPF